jgi:hypothetical protein
VPSLAHTVVAGVPQIEIGSFLGRITLEIHSFKYDTVVGKIFLLGIGIKHSINQYWENAPFNLAAQFVYQGSSRKLLVQLIHNCLHDTIMGVIFILKEWEGFNFYTGFAYEQINIDTKFTFYLPKELQRQLGLLPLDSDDPRPPMYPGDQRPQFTNAVFNDNAKIHNGDQSKTFGKFGNLS